MPMVCDDAEADAAMSWHEMIPAPNRALDPGLGLAAGCGRGIEQVPGDELQCDWRAGGEGVDPGVPTRR